MDFLSIYYYLFLALCVVVYYIIPLRHRLSFLVLVSSIYISSFKFSFFLISVFIGFSGYLFGKKIKSTNIEKKRLIWLRLGIGVNILILCFYKYFQLFDALFFYNSRFFEQLIIPLGLSYYTFQNIGYLYDVYLEKIEVVDSPSVYITYTIFFSKIISGPIEKEDHLFKQLTNLENKEIYLNIQIGARKILWGVFKKIVVANRLAELVDPHFDHINYTGIPLILSSLLYPFQIYADFSGYTDIALGSARLFGLKLTPNFNNPFYSVSITEFWKRWHISLSSWVNEYLFKPLSTYLSLYFNLGKKAVVISLLISFSLLGFWHGASLNFIIFGLLQSIAIIYEFYTREFRKSLFSRLPKTISKTVSIFCTYLFYALSCIFFKLPFESAIGFIKRLFYNIPEQILLIISNVNLIRSEILYLGVDSSVFITGIFSVVFMEIIHLTKDEENEFNYTTKPMLIRWGYYYMIILWIVFCGIFESQDFVYVQF